VWIGATSGPGSVVSSVKGSPSLPDMGRHNPAKQNQSSPVLVNFHFAFGDFVPVNSKKFDTGTRPETTAALYRAKYMVGEAVTRITRTALTLGGAHGIFKGSRLEQLFRDGALAPLHPPPADFCLYNMGIFELGLDPSDLTPPLKPA